MNKNGPSLPLDDQGHLADVLREQGTAEEDIQDLVMELTPLKEWRAPVPSPEKSRQLVQQLAVFLPVHPIRQRLRTNSGGVLSELLILMGLVRSQVNLFQTSFWLASAVIAFLGGMLIFLGPSLNRTFLVQVIGPLLSYLGAASAFRGYGLRMLEFELACPPTPRQLTLARLTIVLGYDITLGFLLSLALGSISGPGLGQMTLHWLAPLFLVIGLTLLLSLRLPVNLAAAVSYASWLAILVFALVGQNGVQSVTSVIPQVAEFVMGLAGIAMVMLWVFVFPKTISSLLPRQ